MNENTITVERYPLPNEDGDPQVYLACGLDSTEPMTIGETVGALNALLWAAVQCGPGGCVGGALVKAPLSPFRFTPSELYRIAGAGLEVLATVAAENEKRVVSGKGPDLPMPARWDGPKGDLE